MHTLYNFHRLVIDFCSLINKPGFHLFGSFLGQTGLHGLNLKVFVVVLPCPPNIFCQLLGSPPSCLRVLDGSDPGEDVVFFHIAWGYVDSPPVVFAFLICVADLEDCKLLLSLSQKIICHNGFFFGASRVESDCIPSYETPIRPPYSPINSIQTTGEVGTLQ